MRVYRDPGEFPRDGSPTCVALGVFDGVHRGHRAVLGHAVRKARERGWQAVAVTFHPHPQQVITGASEPFLVLPLEERLRRMAALGLDAAVVLRFDERLRRTEPEAFVRELLVGALGARALVCGPDFRFGRDRRGDVELLRQMGEALGFEVHVCPAVYHGGERVSSSRIRSLLREGRVQEACELLDQHEVVACVSRGREVLLAEREGKLGLPKEPLRPGEAPEDALWRLLESLGLGPGDVRSVRQGPQQARPQTLELWHPFHVELFPGRESRPPARLHAFPYPPLPEGQEEVVRWALGRQAR
ncbi:Putative riboflavin biosynthesis protein RibF [bacterium HR32]|jgi:FAD synthase|nr:Putative riboflavin biosynthesis protein RibF [bacterium HR32]